MKTISRVEYFEAAHLLPGHKGHCRNLHGHSYMFRATVTSDNEAEFGMIMDYSLLKEAMKAIMPDHMYLHFKGNEISEKIVENKIGSQNAILSFFDFFKSNIMLYAYCYCFLE